MAPGNEQAQAAAPSHRRRLLVLETHPIQYRAPIFQAYEQAFPGELEVVYASDFSVRGYSDKDFGTSFAWDVPLLTGYRYKVLDNLRGSGLAGARSLGARGVARLVADARPDAILMHSLHYQYNWVAYLTALRLRIPIWIRVETQDDAVERGPIKSWARAIVYRLLYAGVSRAFYIGELNRRHLIRHGLRAEQLTPARYCTPDPIADMSGAQKESLRRDVRQQLGIDQDSVVIAFFGKLILKKDPALILKSLLALHEPVAKKAVCLFVGSGELKEQLTSLADELEARHGTRTVFAGFVNQSLLPGYYLASDVVALPSRRMGETWGLVVNEALQAGCGVVISEAVGSHQDLGHWARCRVIPIGDKLALGKALQVLVAQPRDFEWARAGLADYSVHANANVLHNSLHSTPAVVPARDG